MASAARTSLPSGSATVQAKLHRSVLRPVRLGPQRTRRGSAPSPDRCSNARAKSLRASAAESRSDWAGLMVQPVPAPGKDAVARMRSWGARRAARPCFCLLHGVEREPGCRLPVMPVIRDVADQETRSPGASGKLHAGRVGGDQALRRWHVAQQGGEAESCEGIRPGCPDPGFAYFLPERLGDHDGPVSWDRA